MNPLVFEPYLRPQVWGGRKLAEWHKRLPDAKTYGESWEISGHPLHVSRVAEGEFAGLTIDELWTHHAAALTGRETPRAPRFPLLFKYLEANELLSVQVHPTDELAQKLIGDESGKTEAWVILETEPTGRIYAGLKQDVTPDDLARHLDAGTIAECLHSFQPRTGDCIFLAAGTVHAVGGGVLFAEVQQTSDATFRLFDWNRLGTDGQPRQLHKTEALQSIDWSRGPVAPVRGESLDNLPEGVAGQKPVVCEYFAMTMYEIHREFRHVPPGSFEIWMLLDGEATLQAESGDYHRKFTRGETVLVPASCGKFVWENRTDGRPLSLLHVLPR